MDSSSLDSDDDDDVKVDLTTDHTNILKAQKFYVAEGHKMDEILKAAGKFKFLVRPSTSPDPNIFTVGYIGAEPNVILKLRM